MAERLICDCSEVDFSLKVEPSLTTSLCCSLRCCCLNSCEHKNEGGRPDLPPSKRDSCAVAGGKKKATCRPPFVPAIRCCMTCGNVTSSTFKTGKHTHTRQHGGPTRWRSQAPFGPGGFSLRSVHALPASPWVRRAKPLRAGGK